MSSISTICNVAPGLKYYSCTSPNFTGCCSENPCTDSGCPDFGSCNADKGETVCGFICCPSDYGCGEWGQFCNDTNGSIFQPAAFTSNPPLSKTAKSTTSSPSRKSTSTSSFIAGAASKPSGADALTSSSTAAVSSTPVSATSDQHSHTAVIAGSVGGILGALVAALFIGMLLLFRKRRRQKRAAAYEGPNVKFLGGEKNLGTPPGDVSIQDIRNAPASPIELLGSTYLHGVLSGGEAVVTPELSPNPERESINAPRRPSASSWTDVASNAGTTLPADDHGVYPNLNHSQERNGMECQGAQGSNLKHVMSWMDYDSANKGPVR